jgi:hypothetical protein
MSQIINHPTEVRLRRFDIKTEFPGKLDGYLFMSGGSPVPPY